MRLLPLLLNQKEVSRVIIIPTGLRSGKTLPTMRLLSQLKLMNRRNPREGQRGDLQESPSTTQVKKWSLLSQVHLFGHPQLINPQKKSLQSSSQARLVTQTYKMLHNQDSMKLRSMLLTVSMDRRWSLRVKRMNQELMS